MRKLLLAPFGAHDAGERLLKAALAAAAEPRDILYLCPSPRRIDQAKAELLQLSGRDVIVPPQFMTLPQLARDIHDHHGTARRLPSELKPLLVQRILVDRKIAMPGDRGFHCAIPIGDGEGKMVGDWGETTIRRSKHVFIPAGMGDYQIVNTGSEPLDVVCCYPPTLE